MSRDKCFYILCRNGYKLLSLLQLCSRFLSQKLCDDMGWIHPDFSDFGIFLLVCNGWFAILISAGILGFMINSTLSYGMWYINIRSFLHLIMLFLGIIILHKSIKETVYIIALAIPITVLLDILIPFYY